MTRPMPFVPASSVRRPALALLAFASCMAIAAAIPSQASAEECTGRRDSTGICVSDPKLRPVPQGDERLNLIVNQTNEVNRNFDTIVNDVDQVETELRSLQQTEVETISSIDGDVVEVAPLPDGVETSVVGILGEKLPQAMPPPSSFVGWKNGGWSWMQWPADHLVTSRDIVFEPVENAPRGTRIDSAAITVSGLSGPTKISVVGQGDPRLVIDGGAPVQSGTVENGQTLKVSLTSSAAYGTEFRAIVHIGEASAIFTVTTEQRDAYSFLSASGGTVETYGNFRIHEFRTSGRFAIDQVGTHPQYGNRVYFLIMGGGGGGGAGAANGGGGGGGAGALRTGTATGEALSYAVEIGQGGAGAASNAVAGGNGGMTKFANITVAGGGGGGSALSPTAAAADGRTGGSGGGGGSWLSDGSAVAGAFGGSNGGRNGGSGSVRQADGVMQSGGGGGGSWLSAGFSSSFAGAATGGDSRMDPVPNYPYSVYALSKGGNGAAASATRHDGASGTATSFGGDGGAGPGGIGGNGAPGAVYIWYRFQ